jgi:hypothetical protein
MMMVLLSPKKLKAVSIFYFALLLLSQLSQDRAAAESIAMRHQQEEPEPAGTSATDRQVWAWASWPYGRAAMIQQLHDYPDLFDGIEAFCGCYFTQTGIFMNETVAKGCMPLIKAAKDTNTKVQLMIGGIVPEDEDVGPFVDRALALSTYFGGLDGFSLDDETDCAPRAKTAEFEQFMVFHNAFSKGLKKHGFLLTSAIQAIFGIESTPGNQPCARVPADYVFDEQVAGSVASADLQKWLVMDTYYYTMGRFLTTLDWHVQNIPSKKLAIGMSNREELTVDDLTGRFYAIDKAGIDWINMFMMPISDAFLPFLQRWKTNCAGCGVQTILGCYDMDIECNYDDHREASSEDQMFESLLGLHNLLQEQDKR